MSASIPVGICVSPDAAAQVAPGYDHIELVLASVLAPLEDEAAFAPRLPALLALRPVVRAFNVFVPGVVKVVGPAVDWERVERYVDTALRRVQAVSAPGSAAGPTIVVFGSGAARAVPEGFSRTAAWEQLVRFLNLCADYAGRYGVLFAIEPINVRECNIVNTYLEAVHLAKEVQRPEVRALADIYHFQADGEPLDDILLAPEWLAHVHLADSGRLYPGSGSYPLPRLFAILKEIGYQGMTSVECSWGQDLYAETAAALRFLRTLAGD